MNEKCQTVPIGLRLRREGKIQALSTLTSPGLGFGNEP
jgi:hypothetical protein